MQFVSPLGTAAWIALACVPVAIVALYFLKLRRRPVQISSTLLWRRSMEDLHVNSLFQRLRRNLLLFLQLLAIGLAMLALAGPRIRGSATQGQRYILLVDRSASMAATDTEPTRLERAKAEAQKVIDALESDDLAMIIAFADRAQVVSNYTANRSILTQRLKSIATGDGTTSLRDALQVAAGLANPSSDLFARNLPQGVVATKSMVPPRLMIYTDGGFPDVEGFSVGNLEPEVVVIGPPPPAYQPREPGEAKERVSTTQLAGNPSDNVAILALQSARNEEKPDQFQVFGRVQNFRAEPVSTLARLFRHDPQAGKEPVLIDTLEILLPARGEKAFKFDLPDTGPMALEARLDVKDALDVDNSAFAVHGDPHRARVLLVTAGNRYLADTLATPATTHLTDVVQATPEQAKEAAILNEVRSGRFDLVVYDNVSPTEPPDANALYFGALPPGPAYANPKLVEGPVVLDWDVAHPLLQYIRDLNLIRIAKANIVEPPAGSSVLIESNAGPLAFVAPRQGGYSDTVIGFSLLEGRNFNTDWPIRSYSFPLFVLNSLRVLGSARESSGDQVYRPGQPVTVQGEAQAGSVTIVDPAGTSQTVSPNPQGAYVYTATSRTGLYEVRSRGSKEVGHFAVNLFDPRESDLATRGIVPEGAPASEVERYRIKIGFTPVKGTRRSMPVVKDWWKPLTALALGVLLLEWYIYNRRVYI